MLNPNPLRAGARDPALTLEQAFASIALDPKSDGDGLRLAVCDYVDAMKGDGWSPERVIVAVKQIASRVGVLPPAYIDRDDGDGALARAVRWCIERYYDGDETTK